MTTFYATRRAFPSALDGRLLIEVQLYVDAKCKTTAVEAFVKHEEARQTMLDGTPMSDDWMYEHVYPLAMAHAAELLRLAFDVSDPADFDIEGIEGGALINASVLPEHLRDDGVSVVELGINDKLDPHHAVMGGGKQRAAARKARRK